MSDALIPEVIKAKRGRPKGRKTSARAIGRQRQAKVLDLAAKGVNQRDIASATGISAAAVNKILADFKPLFTELDNVERYRSVRGELLDAAELMALKSAVDVEKHDQAQLQHVAYTLRQLHDMRRLHSNLSTSNVAVHTVQIEITPRDCED
jgi:predicted transcriptional regulator